MSTFRDRPSSFPFGEAIGLLILLTFLPARAQEDVWAKRRVTIPSAVKVDLTHTGIHTHANVIVFSTGPLDVVKMQADGERLRHVEIVGHSRLNTDRAALPPEFGPPAKGSPPLENPYGPIDGNLHGKPGWSAVAFQTKGKNGVKISVPTRFANWVAQQPKKARARYLSPKNYSLEITWEEKPGA